jgi:hypothetical protein
LCSDVLTGDFAQSVRDQFDRSGTPRRIRFGGSFLRAVQKEAASFGGLWLSISPNVR